MTSNQKLKSRTISSRIIIEDTYWGKPGGVEPEVSAELHPEKPGTDVILIGEACAPEGRFVTEMFAGISVAGRKRIMKVSGDRYWKKGILSTTERPRALRQDADCL